MNPTHPNDATLLAMAQNELAGAAHADAATHLCECQRCRNVVQDTRELANKVLADRMPEATDALLMRIQGTRATGTRVALDAGDTSSTTRAWLANRSRRRIAGGTGFAAAASIAAIVMLSTTPERSRNVVTATTHRDSALGPNAVSTSALSETGENVLDALSPFPSVAFAQDAPASDDAPLINIDASAFHRGLWTYTEYAVTDGTLARPIRISYTSLAPDTLDGREVWQLVETMVSHGTSVDTMWLDKATFRPILRRWHAGHLSYSEKFSANRVDYDMHAMAHGPNTREYRNKHSAALNPRGLIVLKDAQLRLVLRTQKLHARWRGVFGMPGPVTGPDTAQFGRMALAVNGSSTIQMNGDDIPCWRVVSTGTQVWYVSKRTGEVVQTRISVGNHVERRQDLFTNP